MKKNINFIFIMIAAIFIVTLNVKAHEVKKIEAGEIFCIEKHSTITNYYAYTWKKDTTNNDWPGVAMSVDPNNSNVYCLTNTENAVKYNHDQIIFNNNGSPQTIDLSTVGGGLVYVVNAVTSDGKYEGKWYVYDKKALVDLVNKTENYEKEDYTIASYNNLLTVLNGNSTTVGAKELSTKNYRSYPLVNDTNPFILRSRDGRDGFDSTYETVYNALVAADKAMVKRKKVVVKSVEGGVVTSSYEENSDTKVILTSNPLNLGYKLTGLKITKITGYNNDGTPKLGDVETEVTFDNEITTYNYTLTTSDVYVEPTYEQKQYKLSFKVGEKGKIYDESDREIGAPVTVFYGEDYTLTIVVEDGYEIQEITIDGLDYSLTNGILTIKNVIKDAEVEISFKLVDYVVKIDGEEHLVPHGTPYEQLLKLFATEKEGYTFKGLKDLDGNVLTESYKVKGEDELTSIFEKNPEEEKEQENNKDNTNTEISKNPNTGDSILKYLVLFSSSVIGLVIFLIYKTKKRES